MRNKIAKRNAERAAATPASQLELAECMRKRLPSKSNGPVFFEGKLVLSLSFCRESTPTPMSKCAPSCCDPVDTLKLWSPERCLWLKHSPVVHRYEFFDIVDIGGNAVWEGCLDTQREVALDEDALIEGNAELYRWRFVPTPRGSC